MAEFSVLWPEGPTFAQAGAFPLGTDSVLLADFANTSGVKKAIDLGCGAGAISVLLLAKTPGLSMDGVEILPEAAELCRKNFEANGWDPCGIITGDLRDHRQMFLAGAYDLVVCNPPYFPSGSGRTSPDAIRSGARSEASCSLSDVCEAAAFLCRNGGSFCFVHRPERLAEAMRAMSEAGLEPKRLRLVSHRAESAPSLILIEGRRNARPGLNIAPILILCKPDGSDSDEVKRIYHAE